MQASRLYGVTMAFSSGLLTATGAETVYDTTRAINYSIGGKMFLKTAVPDGTTPTVDGNGDAFTDLSPSQGCVFVWCLEASTTVRVFQGPIRALDESGNFKIAPNFPSIDLEKWCPFAYQIIKAGSGASDFSFGSSNWNATGIESTIEDVSSLPQRPQEPW